MRHPAGEGIGGIAAQHFLDGAVELFGMGAQLRLKFGIHRQMAHHQRHPVGHRVQPGDEQQQAHALQFRIRGRATAEIGIDQRADQIVLPLDAAVEVEGMFRIA